MLLTRRLDTYLIIQAQQRAGRHIHHINSYVSMYKQHLSVLDKVDMPIQFGTQFFPFWKSKKILELFVLSGDVQEAERVFEKNLTAGVYGTSDQWEL